MQPPHQLPSHRYLYWGSSLLIISGKVYASIGQTVFAAIVFTSRFSFGLFVDSDIGLLMNLCILWAMPGAAAIVNFTDLCYSYTHFKNKYLALYQNFAISLNKKGKLLYLLFFLICLISSLLVGLSCVTGGIALTKLFSLRPFTIKTYQSLLPELVRLDQVTDYSFSANFVNLYIFFSSFICYWIFPALEGLHLVLGKFSSLAYLQSTYQPLSAPHHLATSFNTAINTTPETLPTPTKMRPYEYLSKILAILVQATMAGFFGLANGDVLFGKKSIPLAVISFITTLVMRLATVFLRTEEIRTHDIKIYWWQQRQAFLSWRGLGMFIFLTYAMFFDLLGMLMGNIASLFQFTAMISHDQLILGDKTTFLHTWQAHWINGIAMTLLMSAFCYIALISMLMFKDWAITTFVDKLLPKLTQKPDTHNESQHANLVLNTTEFNF